MKFINKNKVYILIFLGCLFIMILFALNETNIFYIIKNFIMDVDYRNNFTQLYGNINHNLTIFKVINHVFNNYKWEYDYMIIWGTNIFQILIPCLGAIAGLIYFKKNQTIYKFSLYRCKKSRFNFFFKEASKEAFKVAISIFLAYITFYSICIIISKGVSNPSITRELFLDLLGDDFYYNHNYLYYLLEGTVRMFIVPYIYAFISCSIALISKSQKQVFFTPIAYYFGLTFISTGLNYLFGSFSIYLNPTTIMVSGAYTSINTPLLIMMNFFIFLIGIFLIKRKVKNVEL